MMLEVPDRLVSNNCFPSGDAEAIGISKHVSKSSELIDLRYGFLTDERNTDTRNIKTHFL